MKPVTVYLKTTCPFCHFAVLLLNKKNVSIEKINISKYPERREEMIARANGRTTVPQIFIGDKHIGGYDDLSALDKQGQLDPLLADE